MLGLEDYYVKAGGELRKFALKAISVIESKERVEIMVFTTCGSDVYNNSSKKGGNKCILRLGGGGGHCTASL